MHRAISTIFFLCTAALLAVSQTGCSKEAKLARYLKSAREHLAAGHLDRAEIEYMNVLQLDRTNATAIADLGAIYFDQGRFMRAAPFLHEARRLRPDDTGVRSKLALLFLVAGARKQAAEEARFILEKAPADPDAPIVLAEASVRPEDIAEARQVLQGLPAESAPVLTAMAMLHLRERKPAEAEAALNRATTADPRCAAAWAALGLLRTLQGDPAAAEDAAKRSAEFSPPRSMRRLAYAQFKIQNNDLPGARRILEAAVEQTPDFVPALLRLAEVAVAERRFDDAAKLAASALARDPGSPEARVLAARIDLARGKTEAAATTLEGVAADFPQSAQVHFQLALARLAQNDLAKAAASLGQTLALAPDNPEATLMLAGLNLRRGDTNAAIAALRELLQKRPQLVQARFLLVDALRAQGNLDEALAALRDLEEQYPQAPQPPLLIGLVLLEQKKPAEARRAFEAVLARNPEALPALEQLVALDLQEKNPAAARSRLEPRLAANPKAAGLQLLWARVAWASDRRDEAVAALEKAIELQPDNRLPYLLLARLRVETGEQARALDHLRTVVAKNPKDVGALTLMAMIQEQAGEPAAARETYERILAADPDSTLALNNLAYLLSERFGETDKAYELAQRARELLPYDPHTADTLGWILFKRKQYPRAITLLQESAEKLPASAEVHYHLGMAHYMLGEEAVARTALHRATDGGDDFTGAAEARDCLAVLEIDPATAGPAEKAALEKRSAAQPDPVVFARLAAIHERGGRLDLAIENYDRSLKLVPNNARNTAALARLQAANKQPAKALELAKAARKLAPDDPEIAHILGALAFSAGDHAWAASVLETAARQRPADPELLLDYAMAAYATGRVHEAATALRAAAQAAKAPFPRADEAARWLMAATATLDPAAAPSAAESLQGQPGFPPGLVVVGLAAEARADTSGAIAAYERVLALYPGFTPAMRRLAVLLAEDPGKAAKACELAMKARDAFPDDDDLTRVLGITLCRRGDHRRAAEVLAGLSARRPDDAVVLFHLGMAQTKAGNPKAGREALERAVQLGLPSTLAAEAASLLK